MLAAEAVKLRGIMTGPRASVEGVETELRRCGDAFAALLGQPLAAGWVLSGRAVGDCAEHCIGTDRGHSGEETHSGKYTPE